MSRVVQFPYVSETKRKGNFQTEVKIWKKTADNIGVYANWFYGVKPSESKDETNEKRVIAFRPEELQFTCGLLSVKNYVATIHPSAVRDSVNSVVFMIILTCRDVNYFRTDFTEH